MQWVTIIWSMTASACLTLGLVHALVWWHHREKLDRLFFALLAVSTAWFSYFEWSSLQAQRPEIFLWSFRWMQLPTWCMIAGLIGYVITHLRAGNWWIAGLALGLRTLAVGLIFFVVPSIHFVEFTGLEHVVIFGAEVSRPIGSPSMLMLVPHASLVCLLIFVAGAARTVWRRGERRRAVVVGGSMVFFVLLAALQTILGFWQIAKVPPGGSLFFLALLFVTTFELSMETTRVKALSAELRETRASNRDQVARLGRVATFGEISVALAHEMNQPLGIILSNAQAAQRILAKDPPDLPEVRAILADIVSENLRASEVVSRMRALLRRNEVNYESLNLSEIAVQVIAILRVTLRDHRVELTHDIAVSPLMVSADRVQLQQLLLNLMLNACEAMSSQPPGARRLHLATRREGTNALLSVADSGPGLPDSVEQIFQPFYTTKPQGLGMGLAICRSIATSHRGDLAAFANANGGATFQLILPALTALS